MIASIAEFRGRVPYTIRPIGATLRRRRAETVVSKNDTSSYDIARQPFGPADHKAETTR
jgi:hypothetical protein